MLRLYLRMRTRHFRLHLRIFSLHPSPTTAAAAAAAAVSGVPSMKQIKHLLSTELIDLQDRQYCLLYASLFRQKQAVKKQVNNNIIFV